MHTLAAKLAASSAIAALVAMAGAYHRSGSAASGDAMCFLVADAEQMAQLEGVAVSAITPRGPVLLGRTGTDGALCVAKQDIAAEEPYVILLCKDGFFCGALEVKSDRAGHDFLDYNEHFIALARFKIG